jgi:hypothetical protein
MAHFAQLDDNNVVINVLVVDNTSIGNLEFPQSEAAGIAYLNSFLPEAKYAQTSYNHTFRMRFAGLGDVFYPDCTATPYGGFGNSKPYDYFVFDNTQCLWIPPIPYPDDGGLYCWDDSTYSWIQTGIKAGPVPVVIG